MYVIIHVYQHVAIFEYFSNINVIELYVPEK